MNNVDLNDMRLFVAVVQAGSLSKAADLLCQPKSRLSRRLTRLENMLGTALLDRGRRGAKPNELGELFYAHAQTMLDAAQAAVSSVQQGLDAPSGLLRLSVSTEMARELLAPHLAEYLRRYPDVSLDIQVNNERINMIQDGIDIALRAGTPDNDHVVAKKLCDIHFGLYATSGYLNQTPPLHEPQDLHRHTLLYKYDGPAWRLHCQQKTFNLSGGKRFSCNDFHLIARLVDDGAGIALLPRIGHIIRPEWVSVLPDWQPESSPLHLLYYKNRGAVPAVRSMTDFLLNATAEHR